VNHRDRLHAEREVCRALAEAQSRLLNYNDLSGAIGWSLLAVIRISNFPGGDLAAAALAEEFAEHRRGADQEDAR
jgi:hypothetical protein